MSAPAISVLIVNYRSGPWLADCLRSLAGQSFRDFEIILVDNGSEDGSMESLPETEAPVRVLRPGRNLGFAAANNLAAQAASGAYLATLNPDAAAAPDWLERLFAAVRARPDFPIVASRQLLTGLPDRLDGAGDCYLAFGFAWRGAHGWPVKAGPAAGECFGPCAAAALYPRPAFLEVGGFEERYFCYHEDVDLAFRLRLRGLRAQYEPGAVVEHAGSAITGRGSEFSVYHGVRNTCWTYFRNMPAPFLLAGWPLFLAGLLGLCARGALIGRLGATFRGVIAGFRGLPHCLRERSAIQAGRTASLAEIARMLSWNPMLFLLRAPKITPFRDGRSRA